MLGLGISNMLGLPKGVTVEFFNNNIGNSYFICKIKGLREGQYNALVAVIKESFLNYEIE